MENKINEETNIIAENELYYIITNIPNTTLEDIYNYSAIIDKQGRMITDFMPLGTIIKDNSKWREISIPYHHQFPNYNKLNVADAIIGTAIGDAYGVPFEFVSRIRVKDLNIKEMLGYDVTPVIKSRWGTFIPSGSWSDDTSMTIATIESINQNNGNINYDDIMKNFLKWANEGEFSSQNYSFGIGTTTKQALEKFTKGTKALECGGAEEKDNGNGSLMRMLPFVLYAIKSKLSEESTYKLICEATSLTHAHEVSKMGCFIYAEYLKNIIETKNPVISLDRIQDIDYTIYFSEETIDKYDELLQDNFIFIDEKHISQSGYIIETLKSVIYSLIHGKNFEETLNIAINLGYDTDTVGAITGGIAGLLYTQKEIPEKWLSKLRKKEYLLNISSRYENTLNNLQPEHNKNKYQ